MSRSPAARWLLLLLLAPVLLLAVTLRTSLGLGAGESTSSLPSAGAKTSFRSVCAFPGTGAERQRLVVLAVDSLRDETAFDPAIMPWLSAHRGSALWGRMQPCVSQLSLLCFRTMFEGAEPLLVTGFHNYTGMSVASDNLIQRLAARGVKVAAVADHAFVSLYQSSLAAQAVFEERPSNVPSRDGFSRLKTFEWLADPQLDVIVSHVIDTDATSHRVGVGHADYIAKFRETDDFLRDVSSRLTPHDSLIILGDHGHDARGYHSTGIPSQTAYFASGPMFTSGLRRDTEMATTLFLMGAVTCEPVTDNYQGSFPVSSLRLTADYAAAHRHVEAAHAPKRKQRAQTSPVLWELPAVLALFALIALIAFASRVTVPTDASGGPGNAVDAENVRRGLIASATLLPGLVFSSAIVPWLAALSLAAAARGAVIALRPKSYWLAAALLAAGLVGSNAHTLLVTLQNHVNARWTVGFWCGLAGSIVASAFYFSRRYALPFRHVGGVVAAASMFLGLAFGPYYYGTARNLLYGTTWLLLSHALELGRKEPRILRWLAQTIVPLIPLYAPILKEWQSTYPLLTWFANASPAALVSAGIGGFVVAAAAARDRRRLPRLLAIFAGFTTLALVTQLGSIPFMNGLLLLVSYIGFCGAATTVERLVASPTARWVLPLGQATYAFMAFFVLLGALRFANVDYRFALELTPIELGEARAALIALPIVTAKYVVPIALIMLAGPPLRLEALLLVLAKAACLAAGLIGFEFAARGEARLFLELQTQETALVAVLYMVLLATFVSTRSAGLPIVLERRSAGKARSHAQADIR